MEKFITILIYIIGVLILLSILDIIDSISNYFKSKKAKVDFELSLEKEAKGSQLSTLDKLTTTTDLLNMINTLITIEVSRTIDTCSMLNIKYELMNIDKDIAMISNNVFHGLESFVFDNNDVLLNNEYIMKYIMDNTTVLLIDCARNYNNNIMNEL